MRYLVAIAAIVTLWQPTPAAAVTFQQLDAPSAWMFVRLSYLDTGTRIVVVEGYLSPSFEGEAVVTPVPPLGLEAELDLSINIATSLSIQGTLGIPAVAVAIDIESYDFIADPLDPLATNAALDSDGIDYMADAVASGTLTIDGVSVPWTFQTLDSRGLGTDHFLEIANSGVTMTQDPATNDVRLLGLGGTIVHPQLPGLDLQLALTPAADSFVFTQVPEPSTGLLVSTSVIAVAATRRRRRRPRRDHSDPSA